jgi:hypothetical protein
VSLSAGRVFALLTLPRVAPAAALGFRFDDLAPGRPNLVPDRYDSPPEQTDLLSKSWGSSCKAGLRLPRSFFRPES